MINGYYFFKPNLLTYSQISEIKNTLNKHIKISDPMMVLKLDKNDFAKIYKHVINEHFYDKMIKFLLLKSEYTITKFTTDISKEELKQIKLNIRKKYNSNISTSYENILHISNDIEELNEIIKSKNKRMSLEDYKNEQLKTYPRRKFEENLIDFGLGVSGEAGEISDEIKKIIFHKKELDINNLIEEIGDNIWYLFSLCYLLNIDIETVFYKNIKKIRERYPNNKFEIGIYGGE